jgi:predicted metal-binding membrane protein
MASPGKGAALDAVLRHDRAMMVMAIVIITVLAWAYILWLATQMGTAAMPTAGIAEDSMAGMPMSGTPESMAGMEMGSSVGVAAEPAFRSWRPADFALMFAMWAVMMIGMMTPSVAPMVLLYAAAGRNAAATGRPLAATGWFVAGYLSVWIAFSLAATGAQWTLTRLALLTPMMASASGVFGGLVLIAGGLYQWSPLKDACLSQCQTPLGFLMSRGGFRSDPHAAVRLGAQHGAYCVGCCWVLMALLFVGGIMNPLWIAGLTILILAEKIVPMGRLIPRVAGAVMAIAGVVLLFREI